MNANELMLLMPVLVLCAGALLTLLVATIGKSDSPAAGVLTLLTIAASAWFLCTWSTPSQLFDGAIKSDPFAQTLSALVLAALLVSVLLAWDHLKRLGERCGEFFSLMLFASAGMMLMVMASDLMVMFLSLEVMSLALYVLCGLYRKSSKSTESALKYFVIGAFSSAILLYGIALFWGIFNTTRFDGIAVGLEGGIPSKALFLAAVICLVVGLAFKIAAFPFHAWVPDVYQGAPTPVTAFMSVGVKVATFAVLLRFFLNALFPISEFWIPIFWWLAVLTMSIGNFAALVQDNVKRMAAYSSIAHVGYLLIAMVALDANGGPAANAILYYLVAYGAMNLGLFAVISRVEEQDETRLTFDDYRGLGLRHPWVGLALSVFLFSLAGIPPMAGFFGKYYVFAAAVGKGYLGLAVIGVLNSLVSAYFYLRLMVMMYMKEPAELGEAQARPHASMAAGLAIALCLFSLFWFAVGPANLGCCIPSADNLLGIIENSVKSLF